MNIFYFFLNFYLYNSFKHSKYELKVLMVVGVVHFVHVQSKIIIGFHITLILLIIIKCFMIVSSYKIQFFFFFLEYLI